MEANNTSKVQKKTFIKKQLPGLNVEKDAMDTGFWLGVRNYPTPHTIKKADPYKEIGFLLLAF